MRTLLFLLGGFLLLACFYVRIKRLSVTLPSIKKWAGGLFIVLWLAVSLANMFFGVVRAGYSVGEELPIMLLIFLPPAIAAYFFWFKD